MIRLDPYACSALISPGKKKKGLSESMEIVSLNKQEILSLCMLRSKSGNTSSILDDGSTGSRICEQIWCQ